MSGRKFTGQERKKKGVLFRGPTKKLAVLRKKVGGKREVVEKGGGI